MGRDDHIVEIGTAQQRFEEGVGVRQASCLDDGRICDIAVSPVHRHAQLATALNQEQRARADLRRQAGTLVARCRVPQQYYPFACQLGSGLNSRLFEAFVQNEQSWMVLQCKSDVLAFSRFDRAGTCGYI